MHRICPGRYQNVPRGHHGNQRKEVHHEDGHFLPHGQQKGCKEVKKVATFLCVYEGVL